jgi:hypothetical protein
VVCPAWNIKTSRIPPVLPLVQLEYNYWTKKMNQEYQSDIQKKERNDIAYATNTYMIWEVSRDKKNWCKKCEWKCCKLHCQQKLYTITGLLIKEHKASLTKIRKIHKGCTKLHAHAEMRPRPASRQRARCFAYFHANSTQSDWPKILMSQLII